jgi:hypothetical protein
MTEVKVINGDLYIIFNKNEDDVLVSYRLSNGAEFDFYEDELVQLILPNFEAQLNRGQLSNLSIDYVGAQFDDYIITLFIKIVEDTINIKLDASSLMQKL